MLFGCGPGVILHCLYFLFLWFQEPPADAVPQLLCLCQAFYVLAINVAFHRLPSTSLR